ncbi:adenylate/guanylate cyclase domain-containing protein [Mycobacterium cookii]|uniref:adenylate/guanylate cyclase domain-containing protein n=1 Tax=Mycobacterium cookii TaxID=1775 RepID=UPI0013D0C0EE|nr:adenylate/guanylate cyclase domain-containing protein [Mycobacterium cookii]MCV7332123.1 adenylate/guanylate cyclase domain-containing protein [Mycobacterium cookii]
MVAKRCAAQQPAGSRRTPDCVGAVRSQPRARNQVYVERIARSSRILNLTASMAVFVSAGFGLVQILAAPALWWTGVINIAAALIYAFVPVLHRFGELVSPLTFIGTAYVSIFTICWFVGTGSGLQFYFLVAACLVVLQLGVDRIFLASGLAAIAAGMVIILQFLVPRDTGAQPPWALSLSFVVTTISACVMVVATVWYAVREIVRAEAAMELEYERSEALLANILPASVAERLKDPARNVIADKYNDASVLFADIAGFTERASDMPPEQLIRFLDRLYGDFDALVDRHGLEKIKVSGDSYMVVSGVPQPRADHVEALASLALDMADAASRLKDLQGNPLPLRIGLASGPVVAGVVGSRRFFYDVWGDAVNVASRMESTDSVGRIQVPEDVYQRLRDDFVLQERGRVDVKGKGVMRTWYLVGRRPDTDAENLRAGTPETARV